MQIKPAIPPMAPLPEAFFPSLDKCFSGDVQLLSWKRAFLYTCNHASAGDDAEKLHAFLSHPDSIQILSNCQNGFPPPSAKSKTEFESKTAAIHVETNAQSSYDLKEIKADALWLSEKAGIDEISALRITVLEWQNRPATRLLTRFAGEETTSLQSATGVDNLRASLAGPALAEVLNRKILVNDDSVDFLSEKSRRLRLRNLYLSERSHVIKVSRKLLGFFHLGTLDPAPTQQSSSKQSDLCRLGAQVFDGKLKEGKWHTFSESCIEAVRSRLKSLTEDGGWLSVTESNQQVEDLWATTLVEEILHIVQILFLQLQASEEIPSASLVLSWLKLMVEHSFLEPLVIPCQDPLEVLVPLQGFVSLTTIAFLKLQLSVPAIINKTFVKGKSLASSKTPYYLCKEEIGQIHEMFLSAGLECKTANPGAFAWGMILHTMRELALNDRETRELEQFHSAVDSFQSNTPDSNAGRSSESSLYEELLERTRSPNYTIDESIAVLTSDVMKEVVFDTIVALATKVEPTSAVDDQLTANWIRVVLLDFLRAAVVYLDYSPEILEAVLAILNGPATEPQWLSDSQMPLSTDPRLRFVKEDILMDSIFRIARSRFPYETVPFLKLCRALVSKDLVDEEGLPFIVAELENMGSFTQIVPHDFYGYQTVREDENANFVSLVEPLPMVSSAPRRLIGSRDMGNALVVTASSQIPSTAVGQIVSESRPAVIAWQHQYSCLSYLGSWLEGWNEQGGFAAGYGEESVADSIGLLADLLVAAKDAQAQNRDGSGAKRILELASDGLSHQGDIISLIFDIFERNLPLVGSRTGLDAVLESTIACLRFIHALLEVLPGRVWPFLSRSGLLGTDGKGGVMTTIISAAEVTSGNYPFLLGCVRLFDAAVEDAASRAVLRRSPNGVNGKMMNASDWTAGVPSHMMRGILLNFVRAMVDAYNSNGNWRFNAIEQRFEVNTSLARTFERIIYYAYGTNEDEKLDMKATGVLSSSATFLLEVMRPESTDDLPFNSILRLILDGLQTPSTLYLRYLALVQKQVLATLELSARLLQAARCLGLPPSLLEEQLFKASPALVKLYASDDVYRFPIISILEILISGAASDSAKEPPSLVGHLGPESVCLFLDVLSQFDKPLNDQRLQLVIWHFLSTIISKRQPWLAVYILTGTSPRQSLKKDDKQKGLAMRGTPFLQIALDTLAKIEQTDLQVALSQLVFVSHAQEHWPWATPELKKHPQFFTSIVSYVSKLKISSLSAVDQIFATRIAAVVADLCGVYLHAAKDMQDKGFYKTMIPLVSWFSKDAVDVSGYNASLHVNLRKNFEMRYPGCKLADFKRSPLQSRTLGRGYYYDIELGQKLLSYDFAWTGTRNQGFAEEFQRANLNLSLVEAQVALLYSWKFFAIEHCEDFMADREVQKSMALVVQSCLEANTRTVPQEAIFERIQQTRAEFAQALLQRLVTIGAKGAEVFGLLKVVWDALRSRRASYEEAIINDDTDYYRLLLNVLFLALQFHLDSPSRTAPETLTKKAEVSSDLGVVVEIVKVVVAQGFKSLVTYLHEQPDKCTPKDFALLTAILQSALQVKNVDRLFEHIVYHIADNDTARLATSLFSWADQRTVAGDPVYGELSMSFLVKLSTIPMLAEHLAVETVLARISTSRLTAFMRQSKGFGPFDPVPRLYSIWTGGILPLCLNLLYHVMRTAPEVAGFLNQFEGQLTRSAESFAAGRTVSVSGVASTRRLTLSMVSEAYSLALISFILTRFREAGASIGVDAQAIQPLKWDKTQVKDDIEELLERKQSLRARIVATSDKELELARQKPVDAASGAENRLEEKIISELKATLITLGGDEA
ncbi:nucleoporin [Aspergillus homomorphus CBS 101889]|uniref:Nucleoporin NUP188 n=1 Tax=Aspergillus homomorphus (strain CBS 101889) TaxID=1450537 RepID=A0A395HH76_ASPHC|nr:hypothetical protein BO97DRAFT_481464 [Aspergillus homomorphus CBS 101889]RAL07177.1 hypothetical protein BO97DRAFT_481464 [Aspergillus homomorphus CBS 101889]